MYKKSKLLHEVRRRMDERWETCDKIEVYKNLLQMCEGEKKIEMKEAMRIRQELAKQTRELQKDCTFYYSFLGSNRYGNKTKFTETLNNRSIKLAYENHNPGRVLEYLEHANNKQQRELDLLKYRKNKRMALFTSLKLEKAELEKRLETGYYSKKYSHTMQALNQKIQSFVVRQNAAANINTLYQNMLDLLQKDSHYLDIILDVLRKDCEEQCLAAIRTAEMGDRGLEGMDEMSAECKAVKKTIRLGVKRDRDVREIKKKIEDLYEKCQLLGHTDFGAITYINGVSNLSESQENKITDGTEQHPETPKNSELEQIINKIQEATRASNAFDILPKVVGQVRQWEVLSRQMKKTKDFQTQMLLLKQHSEQILTTLKNQVPHSSGHYTHEFQRLKKEIDDEKHQLDRQRRAVEENGHMLTTVKDALAALFELVSRMKEETEKTSSQSDSNVSVNFIGVYDFLEDMVAEDIEKKFPPDIDRNSKILLENIQQKLEKLVKFRGLPEDEDTISKMTMLRQRDEAKENYSRQKGAVRFFEPAMPHEKGEDTTVLSRVEVKLRSKNLVERHQMSHPRTQSGLRRRPKRF